METVRWNLVVPLETDRALRQFLGERGGRKGDLSRIVDEAVRSYLFEKAAEEAKNATADLSAEAVESLVDEALDWARSR